MARRLALLAALAVIAAGGCSSLFDEEVLTTEGIAIERGRAIATGNCGQCHATGVTDTSPYERAPPFRTIYLKYPPENLVEAFAEGITVGHTGEKQMPPFVLEPDEIDDLIAYLESFEPREPTSD